MNDRFLPVTKNEMIERGWDRPDFVYVNGDAYVDHPSFGPAIISRVLENAGFRVAMLSQPDYKSVDDFKQLREECFAIAEAYGARNSKDKVKFYYEKELVADDTGSTDLDALVEEAKAEKKADEEAEAQKRAEEQAAREAERLLKLLKNLYLMILLKKRLTKSNILTVYQ
jgi:hypothetical protein